MRERESEIAKHTGVKWMVAAIRVQMGACRDQKTRPFSYMEALRPDAALFLWRANVLQPWPNPF